MKFSYTWDNYTLSMVYLKILIGIHRIVKITNKFIICFMKLLVDNICLDPSKRSLPNIFLFEEILQRLDLKDFKELFI